MFCNILVYIYLTYTCIYIYFLPKNGYSTKCPYCYVVPPLVSECGAKLTSKARRDIAAAGGQVMAEVPESLERAS